MKWPNTRKIKGFKVISTRIDEMKFVRATEKVIKELNAGKTPGSYYYGWQANIACCIMNNFGEESHDKANKAAMEFLDLLIGCEK